MTEIQVILSANAGVIIRTGGKTMWVDALHEEKQMGFSTLSASVLEKMLAGDAPDYICYTHCHGDHYSHRLTEIAAAKWPKAKLFLPEAEFTNQVRISDETFSHTDDGFEMRWVRLPHEGAQYAHVKHYGLLICLPQCNILIPGDCAVASPALTAMIGERKIDLVLLDFPWITLRKGQEYLTQVIRAEHVLVYHLPFAQDDVNHYRDSAERACQSLKDRMDIRLLQEPLQTECFQI